ncbi:MAG: acyl-CoA reductase, partial [Bacteroidetes bacterium]|nr:acyl-CoA reductase [Bacteroidota bacterium]
MYNLSKNIFPFSELGKRLNKYINSGFPDLFEEAIQMSVSNNPWFPRENIIYSLKAIASSLSKDNLEKWLSPYSDKALSTASKKVAVIMAGNIPLVG